MIWQQIFWNSEKFDVYYFRYSPEKIHNNKFHEKNFFREIQGSCHHSHLVRFWSILFINGLSDIGLHLDSIASISRKKLFFYENHANQIFYKKNHIKILRKKQIKTTRVSSAF